MKVIHLKPGSVARVGAYICLALVMAVASLSNSINYAPFLAFLSVWLGLGSLALLFIMGQRKKPGSRFMAASIWPLFLVFPIGTVLASAILVAANRQDFRDYFADKWRPGPDQVAALRKERSEKGSERLGVLLGFLGCILAFYGTYVACEAHSKAAIQVGWLFCFITVPVGGFLGWIMGVMIGKGLRGGAPCTYCNYTVSFRTKLCPNCGRPFKVRHS